MPPLVRSCNLGLEGEPDDDADRKRRRLPMLRPEYARVAPKCVRVTSACAAVTLLLLLLARWWTGLGTIYHPLL
jgi:hypothetical protein